MAQPQPYGYYYGSEAEQYTFYRLPKALFTNSRFKCLSDGAKILYGLMLDRMGLSVKNGWLDEQDRVYIYFTLEDVTEQMNCKNDKGVKLLAEGKILNQLIHQIPAKKIPQTNFKVKKKNGTLKIISTVILFIFDLFEPSFLQDLSLYVDEMRILKNIYNEFVIYSNRLNTTELNYNKMLAMITYKNLFPRDFNDLQLNRGFVHTLFANKDTFFQEEIAKLHQQISQIREVIEQASLVLQCQTQTGTR